MSGPTKAMLQSDIIELRTELDAIKAERDVLLDRLDTTVAEFARAAKRSDTLEQQVTSLKGYIEILTEGSRQNQVHHGPTTPVHPVVAVDTGPKFAGDSHTPKGTREMR